jgi:hypothetical protein
MCCYGLVADSIQVLTVGFFECSNKHLGSYNGGTIFGLSEELSAT